MARLKQYNGTSWDYIDGVAIPTGATVSEPTLILPNTSPTTDGSIGFDRTGEDLQIGDGTNSQVVHMGDWVAFTPSWTNLTVGTGSQVNAGYYCQVGKTVHIRVRVKLGTSGASVSGTVTMTMPITAKDYGNVTPIGTALIQDTGVAVYSGYFTSNGRIYLQVHGTSWIGMDVMNASNPMSWGAGDELMFAATYEAA